MYNLQAFKLMKADKCNILNIQCAKEVYSLCDAATGERFAGWVDCMLRYNLNSSNMLRTWNPKGESWIHKSQPCSFVIQYPALA